MSNDDEPPDAKAIHKKFRAAVRESWRQVREPNAAAARRNSTARRPDSANPPSETLDTPNDKSRRTLYDPRPADDAAPEDNRPVAVEAHGPKRLWTIPETCTWAATALHAAVNALSSDYGEELPEEPEGAHHLDLSLFLSDSYGAHVASWCAANESNRPTRLEACEALPGLFERAILTVFGLLYGRDDYVQIPPPMWGLRCGLKYSELQGSWCAYPADDSGRWWSKLRVPSAEAMRQWPVPEPEMGGRGESQMARCKADIQTVFGGKVNLSVAKAVKLIEQQTGRRYSTHTFRRAAGKKKP